jgi:hypothetical protein
VQYPLGFDERGWRARVRLVVASAAGAIFALTGGCGHPLETGYGNQGKMQLQFYSPPGATVAVKACPSRSHEINTYPADGDRLERSPEEYAVFNLCPGRYEFKYTAAEGLPNVSVYGELDVRSPWCEYAKVFMRRSFIPISLPSAYYKKAPPAGNEIFPFRGERVRVAIDENDLVRLKQGDVVEKVFVVANLEKASKAAAQAKQDLVVLDRKLEYAEARFREAYTDFYLASDDPWARFFGVDKQFINWEKERLELQQKIEKTQARLKRTQALLDGDHVIIRKGMLALATEEIVKPYHDPVGAADDIGEVLLVMRLGGRHMHWGNPARELAAFKP